MSTPLQQFTDFVTTTNKTLVTGKDEILTEVVSQNYLFSRIAKGKGMDKIVRGGNAITDQVQLDDTTQFSFYQPNANFTALIENVLSEQKAYFRFAHNMWAYTDQEITLNQGDKYAQFKNLFKSKKQACKVNTYNNVETALWTTPSTSTMEDANGTVPYSIPAFITETGLAPAGFTTVMNINPSTKTLWRNQVSTYSAASIQTQLVPAFDNMFRKVNFEAPRGGDIAEYFRDTNLQKFMIVANMDGANTYADITRSYNDRLINQADPGEGYIRKGLNGSQSRIGAAYLGIPVDYVKAMDAIGYSTGEPRFFCINSDFLYPVFHEERYFKDLDPMNSVNAPYTWVVHTDIWYNLTCWSRQRQGIICPA